MSRRTQPMTPANGSGAGDSIFSSISTSRRSFFLGALATGSLMSGTRLFGQAAAETGYRTYEFNDDAALIDALMKLRSSTDGTTTFGWLKADRSAYIYGQVVPLMGLLAGILHKARKVKDGVYALTTLEVTYYLDPETDKLLTQLKMPGSGQVVDVPLYRSGPKEIEVSALSRIVEESTGAAGETSDADEAPASPSGTFAPAGQVKLDRSVGPAFEVDDMVWIKTSEYGRVTPASADDRPVFYNESTTYQGKKIEIEDDSVVYASAQFAY